MTLFYARPDRSGELLYVSRLVVGSAMVVSIVLGVAAILRRDVNRHRAWMTRGYAIGLGAATQMLTLMVGELVAGPPGELSHDLLMGACWVINVAMAEWIIRKRPAPPLLLLADAVRRGEVTPDTKVGELLPLRDAPIADVTLAELASHRSGLSAQGMAPNDAIPFALRYLKHRDPFTQDVNGVLAVASQATLTNRGGFVPSNLGAAVLGHALAAAAHVDYAGLAREHLFTPLGTSATSLPLTAGNLPSGALTGYSAAGVAEAPWTINGWAPAGGARSTTADMARYARALLDGTAPGIHALTPRWELGVQQIGYAWHTQRQFVIRGWKAHGRLAGGDRLALLTSFAVAITTFVIAPLLSNWVAVPTAIWLTGVASLAAGVVGAVLRWPELAWSTGTHPIRRAMGAGATLVSCMLIVASRAHPACSSPEKRALPLPR